MTLRLMNTFLKLYMYERNFHGYHKEDLFTIYTGNRLRAGSHYVKFLQGFVYIDTKSCQHTAYTYATGNFFM